MTDVYQAATSADGHACAKSQPAALLHDQLRLSLQDYFTLPHQDPLQARLTDLLARFEGTLAARGEAIASDFRRDLVEALPALRTFAMSLIGNGTRADDLVQETLAKAWANQHRFRTGTNFMAWLFTILRNQFYSEMRKGRREVEDADGAHAERMTALADQEDVSTLRAVQARIAKLPLPQRQALLLVGAEGFTYEEAAHKLGCQVGTVKSRVSRARAYLVEALGVMVDGSERACA